MTEEKLIDIEKLLNPISDGSPSGEDMSFSMDYDDLKEAAREDDASLSQGEWETDLKVADWPKVISIASSLLSNHTKEFQLGGWLVVGLGREYGFRGLSEGLEFYGQLIEKFWETIYPLPEEKDDYEAREAQLEWFVSNLVKTVELIGFAKKGERTLSIRDWRIAKDVENKARDNAEYREEALKEGRIDEPTYIEAVQNTPIEFYKDIKIGLQNLPQMFEAFQNAIKEKFPSPPTYKEVDAVIKEANKLAEELIIIKGGIEDESSEEGDQASEGEEGAAEGEAGGSSDGGGKASGKQNNTAGAINNRAVALAELRKIAAFFQKTEPHSPVSFLVNRAVKWGHMGLKEWLREVIKDDTTLESLKETLGMHEEASTDSEDDGY